MLDGLTVNGLSSVNNALFDFSAPNLRKQINARQGNNRGCFCLLSGVVMLSKLLLLWAEKNDYKVGKYIWSPI